MGSRYKLIILYMILGLMLFTLIPVARAQTSVIVAGVTSSVIVEKLSERISESIARAEQAGDTLLAQALRNLLTSLDAVSGTSNQILDKTFSSLTSQQQLFFREIDALLININLTSQDVLNKSTEVVELAYQISTDVPFGKDRYVVLRYAPSTIIWEHGRQVEVSFRGLNLSTAKPTLILNGARIAPTKTLLQEATFFVPTDLVKDPRNRTITIQGKIELTKKGFFFDKKIYQDISFTILPHVLGKYSAVTTNKEEVWERSEVFRRDYEFEGRNTDVKVTQTPTKGGKWRIDPASIRYQKDRGEASDALYMDGPASPTGFTMAMRCNEYYKNLKSQPGYGKGMWLWQEVKTETVDFRFPFPEYGYLRINETHYIPLHKNTTAIEGTFVDFRGNTFLFSGGLSVPLVKIRQEGNRLTLTSALRQNSEPRPGALSYSPPVAEILEDVRTDDYSNLEKLFDFLENRAKTLVFLKSPGGYEDQSLNKRKRDNFLSVVKIGRGLLEELRGVQSRRESPELVHSVEKRLHTVLDQKNFFEFAEKLVKG